MTQILLNLSKSHLLQKLKKTPWFSGDFMTPKFYHRYQIWGLMEAPNLKYLLKSEDFFGIFGVLSD